MSSLNLRKDLLNMVVEHQLAEMHPMAIPVNLSLLLNCSDLNIEYVSDSNDKFIVAFCFYLILEERYGYDDMSLCYDSKNMECAFITPVKEDCLKLISYFKEADVYVDAEPTQEFIQQHKNGFELTQNDLSVTGNFTGKEKWWGFKFDFNK